MGGNSSIGRVGVVLLVAAVVVLVLGLLASSYYLLAAGVAVAIFGLLFLLRYPQFAYYAIIAMIPFGTFRKFSLGGVEVKFDWVVATLLFFGMGINHVMHRRVHRNLKSHLWLPLTLFFGVSFVSALLSPYRGVAFHDIQLLAVSYLLIMVTLFYADRHCFTVVLPVVVAGSIALSACCGVIGYMFDMPQFADGIIDGGFKRALGGTTDANALSMMIVFGVPLMGYLLLNSRRRWQRLLVVLMLISCVTAKVMTFSRAGAVLLVVTILAFFWLHRDRLHARNLGLIAGVVGMVIAIALCVIPQEYWMRHLALTSEGDRSVHRRTSYLYVAAEAFGEAPILGHGPGTFPPIYAKSDYSARFAKEPEDRFRRAHNTYVEVLVGTGILGLLLFGVVLVMVVKDFGRAIAVAAERGDLKLVELIKTYRLSFVMLLAYILIFSDLQSKHMLLSLGLSQVALRFAQKGEDPA